MRRVITVILCLTLVIGLTACNRQTTPPRTEPETVLAQELIENLKQEKYTAATGMFNRDLKSKVSAKTLQDVWQSMNAQLGGLETIGEPVTEEGPVITVVIPVKFATGIVNARVSFNERKEIAGLYFSPPQSTYVYTPPAYVDTTSFTEREVVVGSGEWALPGTLSVPVGAWPFPAVVLVHGSGPNDRDETMLTNKPFKDIAQGLATQRIVVLRYDKRTLVHGQKMNVATITPHEETVEDAVLAAELLASLPEVDANQVFILGHSLGGVLAPRITELFPRAQGTIILAGATRPLEDLFYEQYHYIYSLDGLTSIEKQHLKELEAQIKRVKDPNLSTKTAPSMLPFNTPAPYWLYLREHNALAATARITQRMLVLQGERDYQVTMADFAGWDNVARDNIQTKSYPGLDHLFMFGAGEGLSTPSDYAQTRHVDENVIRDIATWIKAN